MEALTAVMGAESEPVLACAAMQALTTLAGHASARLAVLRDSSLLPNLTQRLGPGTALRPYLNAWWQSQEAKEALSCI